MQREAEDADDEEEEHELDRGREEALEVLVQCAEKRDRNIEYGDGNGDDQAQKQEIPDVAEGKVAELGQVKERGAHAVNGTEQAIDPSGGENGNGNRNHQHRRKAFVDFFQCKQDACERCTRCDRKACTSTAGHDVTSAGTKVA